MLRNNDRYCEMILNQSIEWVEEVKLNAMSPRNWMKKLYWKNSLSEMIQLLLRGNKPVDINVMRLKTCYWEDLRKWGGLLSKKWLSDESLQRKRVVVDGVCGESEGRCNILILSIQSDAYISRGVVFWVDLDRNKWRKNYGIHEMRATFKLKVWGCICSRVMKRRFKAVKRVS